MPLARIVTSTPSQVEALSDYLRARGYTVELIEPGTVRTTPVELELDLQGCSAEEAMSRGVGAAEAAQRGERRQAIAYDITGRPVEFAEEEEATSPGSGNAIAQAWHGLRSAGREMLENLCLSSSHLRDWFAEGRQTIQEHRGRHQETRRQADVETEREREAQSRAEAAERSRRQQEEAARSAELAAARERMRQQQEQARREEFANRERRLLERLRLEARRDAVQERFQVEQSRAHQQVAPAEAALTHRRTIPRSEPGRYQRENDWKKAAVAAIMLALLATLGYATYQSRRPAAPLPNRDLVRSQNVSQPVPFGTATVPPPQASTPPPSLAQVPQSDAASAAAPAPSVRPRRVRHTSRYADDDIAENQVIVHRSGGRAVSTRTASTGATPKRISDMEQ